jgi:chromosome partitioning protein
MLQAVASERYARAQDDTPLELLGLLPNKVRHTNLHRDALADVRKLQAGRLTPEDVYLPNSIAFPERDVKGARPHSVFHLRDDHPARLQSEIVGEFVYQRVFQNQLETKDANQMDVQTA